MRYEYNQKLAFSLLPSMVKACIVKAPISLMVSGEASAKVDFWRIYRSRNETAFPGSSFNDVF